MSFLSHKNISLNDGQDNKLCTAFMLQINIISTDATGAEFYPFRQADQNHRVMPFMGRA